MNDSEISKLKTALENAKLTSRLLAAVLAFELGKDMLTNGLWMLQPESMMGRIAKLSSSAETFAFLWMTLAILVAPYLALQATGKGQSHCTQTTRLACWAVLTSGVFWIYLGYLSKNLDYAYITNIFMVHGITCVAFAGILASGLNALQRERQESAA